MCHTDSPSGQTVQVKTARFEPCSGFIKCNLVGIYQNFNSCNMIVIF